jgi:hypothetical protein
MIRDFKFLERARQLRGKAALLEECGQRHLAKVATALAEACETQARRGKLDELDGPAFRLSDEISESNSRFEKALEAAKLRAKKDTSKNDLDRKVRRAARARLKREIERLLKKVKCSLGTGLDELEMDKVIHRNSGDKLPLLSRCEEVLAGKLEIEKFRTFLEMYFSNR